MSLKDTDVKTPGEDAIAKKFKLSLAKVRQLVKQGAKHEKEHNTNLTKAKQVARDHITERPDYYKMLDKAQKTDKNHMKEESGVAGVRGLGYVSGDPSGTNYVQQYVDSNAMSYNDQNGNKLEWIKKKHKEMHNKKLGFSSFDPTNIDGNKNFVNEGMSAGPERESDYSIGDPGGGRTLGRKNEIKEVKIPPKVKKAVATGMTLANIATLGSVAGGAAEGRGSPKRDIVAAASGLPGKVGWGATAGHYSIKGLDKVRQYIKDKKQMKEDKDPCWKGYQQVGMKKKGGRKVPNCVPVEESGQVMSRYTERPTYEGYASIGHAYDWAGDVNSKAKFYGNKPKATSTKNDEKDDTYKNSNKGKKVKFAKSVKEEMNLGKMARTAADAIAPGSVAAYDAAKQGNYADAANKAAGAGVGFLASRVAPAASAVLKSTSAAAAEMTPDMENKIRSAKAAGQNVGPVNEIKASTVGRAVAKASKERKELTSKKMGDKEIKQWWKRERLVRRGTEKLSGKSKVPATLDDDPPFTGSHKRSHEKSSTHVHRLAVKAMKKQMGENHNRPDTRYAPGATGITHTIHEETKMDSKELINEAIVDIMDENLIDMKENFLAALNEKVQEKLDERKKDIASNYFGQ